MTLAEWGGQMLAECAPIAAALDAANETSAHREALAAAVGRVARSRHDAVGARSARRWRATTATRTSRFVLAQSLAHRDAILQLPFPADVAERYARLAEESSIAQRGIEAADTLPFETYRQLYLAPLRLNE